MNPECLSSLPSPFYLFDLSAFRARFQACKEIVGPSVSLCYSIKANPFLVPFVPEEAALLEVCSPGELEICQSCGVGMDRILLSGVNKTREDLLRAFTLGVTRFTCESIKHYRLLTSLAEEWNRPVSALLRLSAGSQFGMDEADLEKILLDRASHPLVSIDGLHYFSGTQRKKLTDQRGELVHLLDYCRDLKVRLGFSVLRVEYGTGLYFPYFEKEDRSDTLAPLRELAPDLQALAREVHLTVEMGRFFASPCGFYGTRVNDLKHTHGQNYVILDGGIHQLNYYGGSMGMRTPVIEVFQSTPAPETETYMLCGSLCTTADILVRSFTCPRLQEGDLLLFHACGAYSVTEAPGLFLSRQMPAVYALDQDRLLTLRTARDSWSLNLPALA